MKLGAIFDMDGLMFDTEKMYQDTWNELASEKGLTLSDQFAKEISGTSGELLNDVIRRHLQTDDPHSLYLDCIQRVAEKLSVQVPIKPGLIELLTWFQETGVKLAVASSSTIEIISSNLKVSGTESYFDKVISGSNLEHGKPDPEIFLYAAEQLKLRPEDCYVFEDSINGVHAGLSAGCETVMVPDYTQPDESILRSRAHICSSLKEALSEIKNGCY